MTSLTQISTISRKTIRYGVYIILFLIFGRIFLNVGIKVYRKIFPSPPPPPTVRYGKLEKIPFPEKTNAINLTYTLETPEGGLPTNLPTQAKVFFMPRSVANLLSLDVAKSKSSSLGFGSNAVQVSDTIYRFTSPKFPTTLQVNIITGTFSISYDLINDPAPIDYKPPIAKVAEDVFRSFLSDGGVLPDDLTGTVTHDFLKISEGELVSALSLSESNFIKINLFRKDYDGLASMTANPDQANVWAIISGASYKGQKIIASEYHYHPVDESQYSTYPLKTPTDAYAELQNGTAYIASVGLNQDGDSLKIRRIFLAYFDPETDTDYFQPIYVFEGDNGFMAYTSAVSAEYYGE